MRSLAYPSQVDADGYLDIVLGVGNGADVYYNNNGDKTFTKTGASPTVNAGASVDQSRLKCGDIDGDGKPDLLTFKTIFYSDGGRTFTADAAALSATGTSGGTHLVDVNGDGKLDILYTGFNTDPARLFLNAGGRTFTEIVGNTAAADAYPFIKKIGLAYSFADLDGNGHVDLIVAGVEVFRRNAAGAFERDASSEIASNIIGAWDFAWGDWDGDGFLDLWVARDSKPAVLFRNNGDANFSVVVETPLSLPGRYGGTVHFVDIDNDGDADAFHAGILSAGATISFWRSDTSKFHNIAARLPSTTARCYQPYPGATQGGTPGGTLLKQECYSAGVEDTYAASFGDFDGDGDLDLYIGNAIGDYDLGTTFHGARDQLLRNNGDGTWTSVYSTAMVRAGAVATKAHEYDGSPSGDRMTKAVAFGDYDADGDLDLLIGSGTVYTDAAGSPAYLNNELWKNNGDGTFAEVLGTSITNKLQGNAGVRGTAVQVGWADVDNDGDLDALLIVGEYLYGNGGFNAPTVVPKPELHINNGGDSFTKSTALDGVAHARAFAFGDLDNDGKVDLLLGGSNVLEIHMGNGDGTFTAATRASKGLNSDPAGGIFNTYEVRWIALGDYSGDGYLDIHISNGNNPGVSKSSCEKDVLFRSNGDGTFTDVSATALLPLMTGKTYSSMASWGDIDGDGDLDLVVAQSPLGGYYNYLLRNVGGDVFEKVENGVTEAYRSSYVAVMGDIDGDGDADLFIGNAAHPGPSVGFDDVPGYGHAARGGRNALIVHSTCQNGGNSLAKGCYACPAYAVRIDQPLVDSVHDTCVECPKYMIGSAAGCVPCPAGTTRLVGEASCSPAPIGYFANAYSDGVKPCAVGRFGNAEGRTDEKCSGACKEGHYCAPGSTIPNPPACAVSYYLESVPGPNATTTFKCVTCNAAVMDCSVPGVTVANMPIKAGVWRLSNSTVTIEECFNLLACAGNLGIAAPAPALPTNASNTTNTTNTSVVEAAAGRRLSVAVVEETYGEALCAPGHTGALCGTCKANWHGYTDQKLCTECPEGGEFLSLFLPLIVLLVLLLVALLVYKKFGTMGLSAEAVLEGGLTQAAKDAAKEAVALKLNNAVAANDQKEGEKKNILLTIISRVMKFSVKFKILISLWQILQGLGAIFDIPFPPFYTQAVSSVGGLIQIELPSLMPLDCIFSTSYYSMLVVKCVWPLAFYLALGIAAKAQRKRGKDGSADALINLAFTIMFIVYPSISSSLLSMFYCIQLEDGSSFLRVDLSLDCSTPLHATMIVFTLIMLGLHTIGTPAIYSYLFFWKHHAALEALKEQELRDAYEAKLAADPTYVSSTEVKSKEDKARIVPEDVLPGYVLKLTGGYEYRTCTLPLACHTPAPHLATTHPAQAEDLPKISPGLKTANLSPSL